MNEEFFAQGIPTSGRYVNGLDELYDNVFSNNGGPGYSGAIANILKGIRIAGNGSELAPPSDDTIGLAFVSRPLLNLSDENVVNSPRFSRFYRAEKKSLMNYIRGMLDYRCGRANKHPALNNLSAWIAPLTNLCISSDGFPDLSLDTKTTQPGIRQEVHQLPVGILDDNGANTINMTFKNIKPGIIVSLFENWEHYIPEVRLGDHGMDPYIEALDGHWSDWDCRIYHFIMNPNMISIEQCIMTVQSIPTTFPQGNLFAINNDQNSRRGQGQDTVSIQFKSVGSRANTFEVLDSFNWTSYFFNKDLMPDVIHKLYRKLKPSELLDMGNWNAFPLANIDTMELEWWVRDTTKGIGPNGVNV